MMFSRLLAVLACISAGPMLLSCSIVGGGGHPPDEDAKSDTQAPTDSVVSLAISPANVTVVHANSRPGNEAFSVVATYKDGSTSDVTHETSFALEQATLGSVGVDGVFETSGRGGATQLHASFGGTSAAASIVVKVELDRVEGSTNADVPEQFANAMESAALAPTLIYPSDGTLMPPNIGVLDVHWRSTGSTDAYETTVTGEFTRIRVYSSHNPGADAFITLSPKEWEVIGAAEAGNELQLTVRGLDTNNPDTAGLAQQTLRLTDNDLEGGLYYWAAGGSKPSGVYRHDMSRAGQEAEAFLTGTADGRGDDGRCVACHVLSRDGSKMAVTYDGGGGPGSILDVATRTPLLQASDATRWNFAAFTPDAKHLVTSSRGELTLRDAASGVIESIVPTGDKATHPEFSPDGTSLLYVSDPTMGPSDVKFTGGQLNTISFDPSTGTWGQPALLFVPSSGKNAYYPSWSPDGEWILFNISHEVAYDGASAELYIIPADGSAMPVKLDSPNFASGLTNSWAKWAPFADGLDGEAVFWFTFSSKRTFGVRATDGRPQIWMAPFFPERAANGKDPSGPAFHLPFQDLTTRNHIAQWTEKVVVSVD